MIETDEATPRVPQKMPTLYIPHGGGPCFFMEWTMGPPDTWNKMAEWLKQLASTLPENPKAMIVFSAHWEEREIGIISSANPPLLYDYYGFPEHTYKLAYNAPGSPTLAERVAQLLSAKNIPNVLKRDRGFDHGVFVPLKLVFPEADVPIIQVSLKAGLDPKTHLQIGQALAPLRDEGVLIIGSGMSYHNLGNFGDDSEATTRGSLTFDDWLSQAVCNGDLEERNNMLCNWSSAPSARFAHPREEHLIPLMVAAGAACTNPGSKIFNDKVMGTFVSGYRFG